MDRLLHHSQPDAGAWLRRQFLGERERWSLWLAPLFGCGIAIYFSLSAEPPWWLTLPLWAALVGAVPFSKGRPLATGAVLAGVLLLGGYQITQVRTLAVAAPVLETELGPVPLEGRVMRVEPVGSGIRLLLSDLRIEGLEAARTPARVRVTARGVETPPDPSSRIKALAGLRPPPAPAAPGDYDFARVAWFEKLGAVGFLYGAPELAGEAVIEDGIVGRWAGFWEGLRQGVTRRVLSALPRETGGVAAALITGHRGAIPNAALDDMRDAGLAHLLAISGLHLGLIAGSVFLGLRCLMALWPALALRIPAKRCAALLAVVVAGAYLLLAGAPIPTQRAFIMTAVVMMGVMFDRTAITLRLVAWAALVVLILAPESLVSASFQLSFAAVIALVAAYEAYRGWRERQPHRAEVRPFWRRPIAYLGGIAATSAIAALATAPMTLYHFESLPLYGVLANMVAVPLTALVIMPAALLGLLAMPFGVEGPALAVMGAGIDLVLAAAALVARMEASVLRLPAMPTWGLAACVAGGLWLCLWQRTWRLLGLLPLAVGLASPTWSSTPDVLVAGDGRLFAVQTEAGSLLFNSRRRNRFSAEQWLGRAALIEGENLPEAGDLSIPGVACDALGCSLVRAEWNVSIVFEGEVLEEDCRRADLLLATIPVPEGCGKGPKAPLLVVDSRDLSRKGGLALWLSDSGTYQLRHVEEVRGKRPWAPRQP